ncbi:MAG: hypothetical protein A2Z12_01600 [Actinobacteria bacterium RBG_16_68_21]|nr:MAG: hypothetical protein A2Z12_01600 [Actinobacteria bacterium RBG_16_68_21]
MHEYSLAAEIVDIALQTAGDAPGTVTTVHVTVGPGSHFEGSSLSEAFELAATGTRAAGANLEVTMGPAGTGGVAVTAIDLAD